MGNKGRGGGGGGWCILKIVVAKGGLQFLYVIILGGIKF